LPSRKLTMPTGKGKKILPSAGGKGKKVHVKGEGKKRQRFEGKETTISTPFPAKATARLGKAAASCMKKKEKKNS